MSEIKCPCGLRGYMEEEDCYETECCECCPLQQEVLTMSDREKLIELLKESVRECDPANTCRSCRYRPKVDCVENVTADHLISNGVTVQKWIPVSERLPDGECLAVSMLNGPAYQEMLIGYVGEASNWDTGYECESYGEILPNVTHWMPLPEPPKECE